MSKTDSLVDQHKQILELVGQLNALLDETKLKNDPTPAVMLLANLTGRIKWKISLKTSSGDITVIRQVIDAKS